MRHPPAPLTADQRALAERHRLLAYHVLVRHFGRLRRENPPLWSALYDHVPVALTNAARRFRPGYRAAPRVSPKFMPRPAVERVESPNGKPVQFQTFCAVTVWGELSKIVAAHARKPPIEPVSLNPGGEPTYDLSRDIPDARHADPIAVAVRAELADAVADVLRFLPPRDAEFVRLRFGLQGRPELSDAEIGHRYGITRERVKQVRHRYLPQIARLLAERKRVRKGN